MKKRNHHIQLSLNSSVSVIIPNYNGRKLLEENLPFVVEALKFSCNDFEIIISDDGSTDDSVRFIKEKYPGSIILTSVTNTGFASAANRGIREAKKQLTLLLNSDVKIEKDYLSNQFRYFEKPGTFGVMGSICTPEGKLIDSAKYPQWNGFRVKSTLNYSLKNTPGDFFIPTYFLSGANALADTKKLQTLRGFNEIYNPFYMEDVDLSVRAWRMGWNCYYEPRAICYHCISQTIKKHNTVDKVRLISRRNKYIFHEFHLGKVKKTGLKAAILLNLLFRWMVFDLGYYKSLYAYFGKKSEIEKTKKDFENLHPVKTLEQIVREIRESIGAFEKRLF